MSPTVVEDDGFKLKGMHMAGGGFFFLFVVTVSCHFLAKSITRYTARLDIGKRFKKTNITQTVPNISYYVP